MFVALEVGFNDIPKHCYPRNQCTLQLRVITGNFRSIESIEIILSINNSNGKKCEYLSKYSYYFPIFFKGTKWRVTAPSTSMDVYFTPQSVGEYHLSLSVPKKYADLVYLSQKTADVTVQKSEIDELKEVLRLYYSIDIDEGLCST